METALNVNSRALLAKLGSNFGQASPRDHRVELGGRTVVGRDTAPAYGNAGRGVSQLNIGGKIADEDHAVDRAVAATLLRFLDFCGWVGRSLRALGVLGHSWFLRRVDQHG